VHCQSGFAYPALLIQNGNYHDSFTILRFYRKTILRKIVSAGIDSVKRKSGCICIREQSRRGELAEMKKARRGQTASLRGFPTRAERSHERRYGRDRIPQASEASSRKSTHADSGGQGQGVHRAVGGCRFPAERRGGGLADGSQSTDLQRDALRAAGVATRRLYEDRASGRLDARPGLDAALKALRRGDTLIVWKLDRLGRDLRHLINVVHDLSTRSIGF
jgi:Resolvase, N terminal domain